MAWIGAVVGIVGGVVSGVENSRAKHAAGNAANVRLQQQGMANAIMRRDSIRSFRMNYANAQAAGASEGNVTSSAVQGSLSSATAQESSNLDYFSQQGLLDNRFNNFNKKAGQYASQGSTWAAVSASAPAIGQLASTVYNSLSTPKTTSNVQSTPKSSS